VSLLLDPYRPCKYIFHSKLSVLFMTANFVSFYNVVMSSVSLDGLFKEIGNKIAFAVMRRFKKNPTNKNKF